MSKCLTLLINLMTTGFLSLSVLLFGKKSSSYNKGEEEESTNYECDYLHEKIKKINQSNIVNC